jgi:hypothetical protein
MQSIDTVLSSHTHRQVYTQRMYTICSIFRLCTHILMICTLYMYLVYVMNTLILTWCICVLVFRSCVHVLALVKHILHIKMGSSSIVNTYVFDKQSNSSSARRKSYSIEDETNCSGYLRVSLCIG